MEDAVDAVADAEVIGGGLDVDVRSSLVQGLQDQQVHVPDDRRIVDDGLDAGLVARVLRFIRGGGGARSELAGIAPLVVGAVDVGGDLRLRGHHRHEVAPQDGAHVVHGEHIGGIGRGHDRRAIGLADHEHVVMTGGRLGQPERCCEVDAANLEVDELEAHLLGHAPHEVRFRDQLARIQDPRNGLTGTVVLGHDLPHGLG